MLNHSKVNRQRLLVLALILGVWTAFGLFFGTQNYLRDINVGKAANLSGYLVGWLLCGYAWGFLTVPVLRFLTRFSLARLKWPSFLLVHVPAGAFFSLAQIGIYVLVAGTLSGTRGSGYIEFYRFMVLKEFQSSFLVYFAIIFATSAYWRWSRKTSDVGPPLAAESAIDEMPAEKLTPNGPTGYLRRLSIKENGRISMVETGDIDWIGSYGNYLLIHVPNRRYIYRETMAAMEEKLDPTEFVRIRRSTIVRVDRIKEFKPILNGEFEVVLKSGTSLTSSRRYRKNLESIIKA